MPSLKDLQINSSLDTTGLETKKLENLGQYLDINFKVSLDKNSYEKEVTREINAKQRLNDLQNEILAFLQKKYSDIDFNLDDIRQYFNEFKSPYHDIAGSKNPINNVSYTSEHLNRYLTEDDWKRKYGDIHYKDSIYVNQSRKDSQGNLIRFRVDNRHFGIDLASSFDAKIYTTNLGKPYTFPQDTGRNGGLGNVVIVKHYISKNNKQYPLNIASVFAHLNTIENPNDIVDGNTSIGTEGGTGASSGSYASHLHLELWKLNDSTAFADDIKNIVSVRQVNNGIAMSYDYRFINQLFQGGFIDNTDSKNFKILDDSQKNVQQKSTNSYVLMTNYFSLNTYVNGRDSQQGIRSISKNFANFITDKKYYAYKYSSDKNIIFDKNSISNLNKQLLQDKKKIELIQTFTIEEKVQLDSKDFTSRFKFKFKDYLDAIQDNIKLSEKDATKVFGQNISPSTDIVPLFTFYFPIRLNLFKNYSRRQSSTLTEDEQKKLNSFISKSGHEINYFIKFEIFDILYMNDIFNIKYNKLQKSFDAKFVDQSIIEATVLNNMFRNNNSPDSYYKASIVTCALKDENLDFVVKNQNEQHFTVIFDEYRRQESDFVVENFKIKCLFQELYKESSVTPQLHAFQNQLKIELYASQAMQNNLKIEDDKINDYKYVNFITNYDIPFGSTWRRLDEYDKKYNTDFTRSYMNFFNETGDDNDDNVDLPTITFSTEFDTLSSVPEDLQINEEEQSGSLSIDENNTIDISTSEKYILTSFFHPALSIKCNPFVESVFFTHRLESSYLPRCIYENKFVQTKKKIKGIADTRDSNQYVNYWFPSDYKEINSKAGSANPFSLYSDDKYKKVEYPEDKKTTDNKLYFTDSDPHPVYTFYLNLNDLYFEIIHNMINIEVYNIEDQS